jgi:hypothetical protein
MHQHVLGLLAVVFIALLVGMVVAGAYATLQYGLEFFFPDKIKVAEEKKAPPGPASIIMNESYSADGRVVCFSMRFSANALSCLPTWMLDRPNNWVVMYPKTNPPKKKEVRK